MNSVVVVELRPIIGSCQFYIKFDQQIVNASEVILESDKILIKGNNHENIATINVKNIRIINNSISGFQVSDFSVQFRLRIEPNKVYGCFENEIILKEKQHPEHYSITYRPQITENKAVVIYCRQCSNPLIPSPLTFKRVLPLPTTFDANDFFCHGGPNKSNIEFKSEDCLYGLYFFQINISLPGTEGDEIITCKKCSTWLGVKEKCSHLFWNSSVMLTESDTETEASIGLSDFTSVIKCLLMKDTVVISKVILFSKISNTETNYLLIWFIEKNLSLLLNKKPSTTEIDLKQIKVSKVLYKYETEITDMIEKWETDISSMTIQISKQMMEEGLTHIRKMSNYIPEEFKKVNQMDISYLML